MPGAVTQWLGLGLCRVPGGICVHPPLGTRAPGHGCLSAAASWARSMAPIYYSFPGRYRSFCPLPHQPLRGADRGLTAYVDTLCLFFAVVIFLRL